MEEIQLLIENNISEKEHVHREIELLYILEGTLVLELTGEKYVLKKNDIMVVNSRKEHAARGNSDCLICRIYIDYRLVLQMTKRNFISFWCCSLSGSDADYDELRSVLGSLIGSFMGSGGRETFRSAGQKYMLLACLTEKFLIRSNQPSGEIKDERIDRMIEYINDHYQEQLTLHDLAKTLYMSESSASRCFKKMMGINYVEYINRVRLHYAVEDLLYSQKSVTRISADCGFSNPSVFNKWFRKVYGCAPSEYRERMKYPDPPERETTGNQFQETEGLLKDWLEKDNVSVQKKTGKHTILLSSGQEIGRYQKTCCKCVDFGDAVDLLQGNLQRQLKSLKDSLKIEYVRIGNFCHSKMYFYGKDGSGGFNYAHIDTVLDYVVSVGVIPIINLTCRQKRAFLDVGNFLYIDEEDLNITLSQRLSMYEDFFQHIMNRYGEEQLSGWIFTLEDDEQYKTACRVAGIEPIPYFEFWDALMPVLKRISPDSLIGGSVKLLERGESAKVREPDFVTLQIYPYFRKEEEKDVYTGRITDPHFVKRCVTDCRNELKRLGYKDKRILVTEWNTSLSERNSYNDSCAKAAHVLMHMIDHAADSVMFCYHNGSDYLSQFYDTDELLFGGNGLLSKTGIPKPVWYAFYFMNCMHENILAKENCCLVTENKRNNIQMVICCAKTFGHAYYLKRECEIRPEDIAGIFADEEEEHYEFVIRNLPDGSYVVKQDILKTERGNLLREWEIMGRPKMPDEYESGYLQHVCRPLIFTETLQTDKKGTLKLQVTVKAHEIVRIQIRRLGEIRA